jgi:hypothetical protein
MLSPAITIGDGSIRHRAKSGKLNAFGNRNLGGEEREGILLIIILIRRNQIP